MLLIPPETSSDIRSLLERVPHDEDGETQTEHDQDQQYGNGRRITQLLGVKRMVVNVKGEQLGRPARLPSGCT